MRFDRMTSSPSMRDARPDTIIPVPRLTSVNPWNIEVSAPETAVNPLERQIPLILITSGFMPCEITSWGFAPSAPMLMP